MWKKGEGRKNCSLIPSMLNVDDDSKSGREGAPGQVKSANREKQKREEKEKEQEERQKKKKEEEMNECVFTFESNNEWPSPRNGQRQRNHGLPFSFFLSFPPLILFSHSILSLPEKKVSSFSHSFFLQSLLSSHLKLERTMTRSQYTFLPFIPSYSFLTDYLIFILQSSFSRVKRGGERRDNGRKTFDTFTLILIQNTQKV